MKFTELLPEIQATHPEWPRRVQVIATRYYIGAETIDDLNERSEWRTRETPQHSNSFRWPTLTEAEAKDIIRWR